jgi:phosphatidylglycerophosphate synthase
MPVWFVAIIFGRDIIVSYVRTLSQQMGFTFAARNSGKFKAFVQAVAQFSTIGLYLAVIYGFELPAAEISFWLLAAATLFTAYSCVDYVRGLLEVIQKRKSED